MSGMSLKDQIAILEDRLKELTSDDGGPQDVNEYNQVFNRLSELKHQLDQQEQERAERTEVVAQKIEEAVQFDIEGVDFTELPSEVIELINIVVKADRKRIYKEQEAEIEMIQTLHREQARGWTEREIQYQRQNSELQKQLEEESAQTAAAYLERDEAKRELHQTKLELADHQQRFNNAIAQLEEEKAEVERLNRLVSEYQMAKVFGENKAQKIIDITPEKEKVQNLVNSINKRYIEVNHINGNFYEAIADDGSKEVVHKIHLPELNIGGGPFRSETTPTNTGDNQISNQSAEQNGAGVQQTVGQFQTDGPQLDQTDTGVEMAGKTLEERVAELEKAVFGKAKVA